MRRAGALFWKTPLFPLAFAGSPRQRRRIERAAEAFLQRHPGLAGLDQRFDVVLLAPRRRPHHLENAWHIEEALPPPPAGPKL